MNVDAAFVLGVWRATTVMLWRGAMVGKDGRRIGVATGLTSDVL